MKKILIFIAVTLFSWVGFSQSYEFNRGGQGSLVDLISGTKGVLTNGAFELTDKGYAVYFNGTSTDYDSGVTLTGIKTIVTYLLPSGNTKLLLDGGADKLEITGGSYSGTGLTQNYVNNADTDTYIQNGWQCVISEFSAGIDFSTDLEITPTSGTFIQSIFVYDYLLTFDQRYDKYIDLLRATQTDETKIFNNTVLINYMDILLYRNTFRDEPSLSTRPKTFTNSNGTFEINETLDGEKYYSCLTSGDTYFNFTSSTATTMTFDYYDGTDWESYSGIVADLEITHDWLNLDGDRMTFTLETGQRIKNIIIYYAAILDDNISYGIEWDITNSNPVVTRIGDLDKHVSLPLQNKMRGCLMADNGAVNYYLNSTDWSKKANGDASNLDGTDGQVMIEIPAHYYKWEESGNTRRIKISEENISGFTRVVKFYIGAYKAALNRSNLELASVQNVTSTYKGGNNTTDQQLGMPATSISRTNYRTYANNRGSTFYQKSWENHQAVWRLFLVEYATRNSQTAVDATLTAEGYKQGGLGSGVTNIISGEWSTFNGYNPLIPCGTSNSLANGSGEVSYTIPDYVGTATTTVNRYRGVENPFGDIWEWADGCNIYHQTVVEGGKSLLYVVKSPSNFTDVIDENSILLTNQITRTKGYIKQLIGGANGVMMSEDNGGGLTTYWADYCYSTALSYPGLRAPLVGGSANYGVYAGFGCVYSHFAASSTSAFIGSRLCCLGL